MAAVMRCSELWGGELVPCRVGANKLFLVRLGDQVFAYRDRCPHQGVALSEGTLEGRVLTCRAHLHQFDVISGGGINPADCTLTPHAVRVEGDVIYVEVGDE